MINANDYVVIEEVVREDYDPSVYLAWFFKPGQLSCARDETLYALRLQRVQDVLRWANEL